MATYFYHFTYNISTGQAVSEYYPSLQFGTNTAISIYTFDPTLTGIENINYADNSFATYPNPANNSVTLTYNLDELSTVTFKLYDAVGKLVKVLEQRSMDKGTHSYYLDVNDLAEGLYIVHMNSNKAHYQQKLIIQH